MMGLGFSKTLAVIRSKPTIGGGSAALTPDEATSPARNVVVKRRSSITQVLPAIDPKDLDAQVRVKTRRLPRAEGLLRTPLLVEFVGTAAISVGPSPHVRPDLIGKTIAGGISPGGNTTASVGLRSSPSGFANYGNTHKKKRKTPKKGTRAKKTGGK